MKQYISILVFVVVAQSTFAQSEVFSTKEGAINGYDAVAYFAESKPVEGKKENSFVWKGETWYFSSSKNRETFKSNPEKYAPQFGGFCAYGVADGHKAKTDPQAWTVVDDKLYLNYNKDVQQLWKKDQKNFVIKAHENWPKVKKEKF
jgi:YHS domain-containing protein